MKTLDELDRLEKEATAGPWFYDHYGKPECELESLDDKDVRHGDIWFHDDDGHRTAIAESIWWDGADGELIVAMRNNIRPLIEVAKAASGLMQNVGDVNKLAGLLIALERLEGET
jgi:hypothetical protein